MGLKSPCSDPLGRRRPVRVLSDADSRLPGITGRPREAGSLLTRTRLVASSRSATLTGVTQASDQEREPAPRLAGEDGADLRAPALQPESATAGTPARGLLV